MDTLVFHPVDYESKSAFRDRLIHNHNKIIPPPTSSQLPFSNPLKLIKFPHDLSRIQQNQNLINIINFGQSRQIHTGFVSNRYASSWVLIPKTRPRTREVLGFHFLPFRTFVNIAFIFLPFLFSEKKKKKTEEEFIKTPPTRSSNGPISTVQRRAEEQTNEAETFLKPQRSLFLLSIGRQTKTLKKERGYRFQPTLEDEHFQISR